MVDIVDLQSKENLTHWYITQPHYVFLFPSLPYMHTYLDNGTGRRSLRFKKGPKGQPFRKWKPVNSSSTNALFTLNLVFIFVHWNVNMILLWILHGGATSVFRIVHLSRHLNFLYQDTTNKLYSSARIQTLLSSTVTCCCGTCAHPKTFAQRGSASNS